MLPGTAVTFPFGSENDPVNIEEFEAAITDASWFTVIFLVVPLAALDVSDRSTIASGSEVLTVVIGARLVILIEDMD